MSTFGNLLSRPNILTFGPEEIFALERGVEGFMATGWQPNLTNHLNSTLSYWGGGWLLLRARFNSNWLDSNIAEDFNEHSRTLSITIKEMVTVLQQLEQAGPEDVYYDEEDIDLEEMVRHHHHRFFRVWQYAHKDVRFGDAAGIIRFAPNVLDKLRVWMDWVLEHQTKRAKLPSGDF